MKAKDVMSTKFKVVSPHTKLHRATRLMEKESLGYLPVAENNKLIGFLTDRDVALRGLGNPYKKTVQDAMSNHVYYCYEDQDLKDIARNMGELNIRRLPVLNKNKKLVGTLSLTDITNSEEAWRETHDIISRYNLAI